MTLPPERCTNRLMSQQNAQKRHFAGEMMDQRNGDSRFLKRARAGREHDALRCMASTSAGVTDRCVAPRLSPSSPDMHQCR